MDKYISIFFSILIFLNAYLVRKVYKNWLYPSSLYCLFWFGYTFFPLVFIRNVKIEPLSVIYIYLTTLFFSLTTFFFPWAKALIKNQDKKSKSLDSLKNSFIESSFYVLTILSFFFLIINSIIQGFSIDELIFNFFESSESYAKKRYGEEIITNPFSQLGYIFTYTSLPLAGILVSLELKKKKVIIAFLSFLPTIFIMVTQSSKGSLFLAIALFYGGVLTSKIFNSNTEIISKGFVRTAFIFFIFIVPLTIISFMSRGLYDTVEYELVIEALGFKFNSYAFGHLYAFSDWFYYYIGNNSQNTYIHEDYSFGFYTFMPIFYLFGSTKVVPMGVFDEYLYYESILETNIYTWFRGLIIDFGLVGSLIFVCFLGILLNSIHYYMLSKIKPAFSLTIYIFMIGFFYTSFIISLLIWKSIYASIILLYIIFKINYYKINITMK